MIKFRNKLIPYKKEKYHLKCNEGSEDIQGEITTGELPLRV